MAHKPKKHRGPYRGFLNKPRRSPELTEIEFTSALDAIRLWWGVDGAAPNWKDKLLSSLLIAHVPAFQVKPARQRRVASEWIADVMNGVREKLKAEGKPATLDVVITWMKENQEPDSDLDIASVSYERLKRIYGDRKQMDRRLILRIVDQATRSVDAPTPGPPNADRALLDAYLEVVSERQQRSGG